MTVLNSRAGWLQTAASSYLILLNLAVFTLAVRAWPLDHPMRTYGASVYKLRRVRN